MAILPGDMRCVVTLNMDSGLPEDAAVNVWHLLGTTSADPEAITDQFVTFYGALGGILANVVDRTEDACQIQLYDLTDPEPRPPVYTRQFTISGSAAASSDLPAEVAICTSIAQPPVPGFPAGRGRGRAYIGPLNTSVMGAGTGESQRVSSGTQDTIAGMTRALVEALAGTTGAPQLAIFSRTNNTLYPVLRGWVDNAFDTQRRRGVEATTRVTWAAEF